MRLNPYNTSQMKHIVYCIGELQVVGGIGRIISQKANWLAQHGYRVTILTTELKGVNSFYHLDESIVVIPLEINYLTVYDNRRTPLGILKSGYDRYKKAKRHKRLLEKFLRENPCDVLFTTSILPFLPTLKDGSRKYLEFHFSVSGQQIFQNKLAPIPRALYKLYRSWQEQSLPHYDALVCLTDRDWKLRGCPKNGIIIPNFITIAPDNIYPENRSYKRAISVGRLSIQKGFDLLFQAWAKVHARHPDWQLDIFGYGYGREEYYQGIIDELGLSKVIHLYPPVKNIANEYGASDLYIMASRYEGFPLTLPEAMACGLPCVSYDIDTGPSDIIRHGEDGILVMPKEDISAMASAILYMIEHKDERREMGKHAKENISRFHIDTVMQEWVNLIER